LFGNEVEIARKIKERIHADTGLTASVGIAPNKLVAKIASDLDKPDGLFVVTLDNMRRVLDPLPVRVIPGIGRKTLARLRQVGIESIADLRRATDGDLEPIFGRFSKRTRDRAAGLDERPVIASSTDKSISAEETFDTDLTVRKDMDRELLRLTERTTSRLRAKSLLAGTVRVKIRRADFTTYTRQQALHPPGNGTDQVLEISKLLLCNWLLEQPQASIRLLGVGCSEFSPAGQQDLFEAGSESGASQLDDTVDRIRDRFGKGSVGRARTLS
jgi:DNA polymerase-4